MSGKDLFAVLIMGLCVFYLLGKNHSLIKRIKAAENKPAPIITATQFKTGQKVCAAVQSELKHISGSEMHCANGHVFRSAKQ